VIPEALLFLFRIESVLNYLTFLIHGVKMMSVSNLPSCI
jgi:hypothetical protein